MPAGALGRPITSILMPDLKHALSYVGRQAHKVSDMDSAATAYAHAHWVGGVVLDEGAVR